nr:unnamed protein product [Callosobruchus analis]
MTDWRLAALKSSKLVWTSSLYWIHPPGGRYTTKIETTTVWLQLIQANCYL